MDICVDPGLYYVASQTNGESAGGGLDLAELAGQVAGRVGDSGDPKGGAVPDHRVVELGDGDVEAVAQLFLEGAHDLAAVFERLRMFDSELEGEGGERHEIEGKAVRA